MSRRSMVSWESADRYRSGTLLVLLGVPLVVMVAVFGQPPVGVHGPLHYLGIMSPTCGLTRGVMWFARGNLSRAWLFNPASVAVLPTMGLLLARAAYGRTTGRWVSLRLRLRPWMVVLVGVVVTLLAIRQQLYVELLMQNPAG